MMREPSVSVYPGKKLIVIEIGAISSELGDNLQAAVSSLGKAVNISTDVDKLYIKFREEKAELVMAKLVQAEFVNIAKQVNQNLREEYQCKNIYELPDMYFGTSYIQNNRQ
jgi:predicted Co/Zn/Cd cation transporter (cation efflux family)